MTTSLQLLPITNYDHAQTQTQKKVRSVLPLFGFINMTISSVVTIYRAHANHDTPMIVFVAFVYFGSFFLDYCFRLYHALPKSSSRNRRNVKIIIWLLLSSIMFGFACEFSTFMSFVESLCFFGLVLAGNTFLFYVYFVWEGYKTAPDHTCCVKDNCDYKPLIEPKVVDQV
ncbi:hypothetical protein CR513_29501, partial [Mucuna pruriens]